MTDERHIKHTGDMAMSSHKMPTGMPSNVSLFVVIVSIEMRKSSLSLKSLLLFSLCLVA